MDITVASVAHPAAIIEVIKRTFGEDDSVDADFGAFTKTWETDYAPGEKFDVAFDFKSVNGQGKVSDWIYLENEEEYKPCRGFHIENGVQSDVFGDREAQNTLTSSFQEYHITDGDCDPVGETALYY